jgi:hypothetical protein
MMTSVLGLVIALLGASLFVVLLVTALHANSLVEFGKAVAAALLTYQLVFWVRKKERVVSDSVSVTEPDPKPLSPLACKLYAFHLAVLSAVAIWVTHMVVNVLLSAWGVELQAEELSQGFKMMCVILVLCIATVIGTLYFAYVLATKDSAPTES